MTCPGRARCRTVALLYRRFAVEVGGVPTLQEPTEGTGIRMIASELVAYNAKHPA